jgi:TM2 domain-containing membrane protein YozV
MDKDLFNLVCGAASAVIPGLGQAFKGQIVRAILVFFGFVFSCFLMLLLIGFITTPVLWLWNIYDAVTLKK